MKSVVLIQAAGLTEQALSVHFSQPDSDDRAEVEEFISNIFNQAYGAKINSFKPCLMSLRDQNDKLVAACGFRSAAFEPLFLEIYLDRTIEEVLAERVGFPVKRNEIVEVGNFSVAEPGMARHLILAINDHLHATANQWVVFTAVPVLRNAFIKLKMNPVILGDADKGRLPAEEQAGWGSYYANKPQVMAMQRFNRRSKFRKPESPAEMSVTRCKTCGMIVRKDESIRH